MSFQIALRLWRSPAVLITCGVALLGSLAAVSRIDPRTQTALFLALVGVAGAAYGVAMAWIAWRRPRGRRLLLACVLLGLGWRIPLLVAEPRLSNDVYRYIWDGRVQRLGHNPYASAPADERLAALHTPLTRATEHPELPTIYPPVAELWFRAVAMAGESVFVFKAAILLCDLALIAVLWAWLSARGISEWWVLAYGWHPLVGLEAAGSGHVDFLGLLLLVGGLLALSHSRRTLAAGLVALSIGTKFLPLVLVPLLAPAFRWRDAAVAGLVLLGAYAVFASEAALLPTGSLATYAADWRFNHPVFRQVSLAFGPQVALALPVLVGAASALLLRTRLSFDDARAIAWPLGLTVLMMPAIYPWYLTWLTPFLHRRAVAPLAVWSLTVLSTYAVWQMETAEGSWMLPWWVLPFEYGLMAAAGALVAGAWLISGWSRRRAGTAGARAVLRGRQPGS